MPWTKIDKAHLLLALRGVKGMLTDAKLKKISDEVRKTKDYKGKKVKFKVMGAMTSGTLHDLCLPHVTSYRKVLEGLQTAEKEYKEAERILKGATAYLNDHKGIGFAQQEVKNATSRYESAKRKLDYAEKQLKMMSTKPVERFIKEIEGVTPD